MTKLGQNGENRETPRRLRSFYVWAPLFALVAASGACSSKPIEADPSAIERVPSKLDPGTNVVLTEPEAARALASSLATLRASSASDLKAAHEADFVSELGYAPETAQGLSELVALFQHPSAVLQAVSAQGFALEAAGRFPSFADGYAELYFRDLPVFISSDMVLEAVYRSHDKILQTLEQQSLSPRLATFLNALRANLIDHKDTLSPEAASDLNFYLGVALSLLRGSVAANEPQGVKEFYDLAVVANGSKVRILFGTEREIDFSQFKPRGHYAGDVLLERYFRAMIWLGRTDFRLIETLPDGSQVLRRRQVESMVALRRLLDEQTYAQYLALDDTLTAFVGEHDYMALQEVEPLLKSLGKPKRLDEVSDTELAQAIVSGQFGAQRVASQVMRRAPSGPETLSLSSSFALFGQRYTVDSHVFSNLVYDRLPTRILPNPLDAAFAALGNDQAFDLLADDLDTHVNFAGELAVMRELVDQHPNEYWQSSLYTGWLGALRKLSPGGTDSAKLPTVARTSAWGRRLLNTQLGSWAQLRHNNVLYVKQSYTTGLSCEYPDAYVDPYPEFFDAIVGFAEQGLALFEELELDGTFASRVNDYFTNLATICKRLGRMARAQQSGEPHKAEDMAFINQAVVVDRGCGGPPTHTGWYSTMHFEPDEAAKVDPTITDVHTDVGGDFPIARGPSVLHVGTALPRLMVTTVDSCQGPRAYAGVVFDYREVKAEGFTRHTDEEWKQMIYDTTLPQVPWLEPISTK